jgi:hypothetical protein
MDYEPTNGSFFQHRVFYTTASFYTLVEIASYQLLYTLHAELFELQKCPSAIYPERLSYPERTGISMYGKDFSARIGDFASRNLAHQNH